MLQLVQTFEQPIGGWWDGGKKSIFHWSITGRPQQDAKGMYVRIGSHGANHWRHVACGKTDKQTLGNLRRGLALRAKRCDQPCTFEYAETE